MPTRARHDGLIRLVDILMGARSCRDAHVLRPQFNAFAADHQSVRSRGLEGDNAEMAKTVCRYEAPPADYVVKTKDSRSRRPLPST